LNKSTSTSNIAISQLNVLSLLDFCKGLAIVWVVLFHYQPEWFGWQGVHVFIVLSGFGLTYSCLKKPGNIAWKQWYVRRSERILPLYWLVSISGFLIMLCLYLFTKDIAANGITSTKNLILNIFLLRNLSIKTIFSPPNDPLWFIPLIVGFYLVFPWLYHLILKYKTFRSRLVILLAILAIEFMYRVLSIYYLDGAPVGYEQHLLHGLSISPLKPLNNIPDTFFLFPFQLQAPFGLFPSRIAEFMLGMLGASLLVQNSQKFHNIFLNYRIGLVGVLIWLAGCSLIFTGLWGWIFADFLIALGLILWIVNLAGIFQQRFSFLFRKISQLGIWSYYIFLSHGIFVYLFLERQPTLIGGANSLSLSFLKKILALVILIILTWGYSWVLIKFDQSKFPKLIIQKTIARVCQSR
jgi:peptidoglycan/LPS O-acetylase OafA/YrhL